jgi:uncharacterized protein YfkK (UPF0435 family)
MMDARGDSVKGLHLNDYHIMITRSQALKPSEIDCFSDV